MVAKSILEIDLKDEPFKDFQQRFDNYTAKLAAMPAAWGAVGKAAKASTNPFDQLRQIMSGINADTKAIYDNQEKNARSVEKTSRSYTVLAKGTASVARNIKDATTQLLKWSSLTSVFSGILGAGGLFGIDRLAQSASNSRRQSQGLGISAGALRATELNYSKAVDVPSAMGNIRDAQNDLSKRWAFNAMGVDANQSPDKLLGQMIKAAKSIQEHNGGTLQGAQSRGLTQFFSMEDLTRFKAMSNAEIDAMAASAEADKKLLAVTDETQKAWQDFNRQMSRSSSMIENVFVTKLGPLAVPLEKLSKSIASALGTVLSDPKLPGYIDAVGNAFESFATYLTSNDFNKNVKTIVDDIDSMAGGLSTLAGWLNKLYGKGDTTIVKGSIADKATQIFNWNNVKDLWKNLSDTGPLRNKEVGGQISYPPAANSPTFKPAGMKDGNSLFSSLEKQYNLPSGLQDAQWFQESRRGKAMLSPAGAKGHFGFMDKTAAQYGVKDPNDLEQSATGNAKMMADLMKHYKGALKDALAAYNWGMGNQDKYLAGVKGYTNTQGRYVDTSRQPRETQKYVIDIMNNTGGNAIVSTRSVAQ